MSKTGNRNDPFPAFRFRLRFDGKSVGGFSECSGLQLETEIFDYSEGGENSFVHKFATRVKQSAVTLKRGVVSLDLWKWYLESHTRHRYKNCSIVVQDPNKGDALMTFQLKRIYPSKWVGPELNAQQSNLAVETLELVHHGLTVKMTG